MSNDYDFLAQNEDGCIAVKVFSRPSIALSPTSWATLDDAVSVLGKEENGLYKPQLVKTTVFEGIVDRRLWLVLVVVVDSDTCLCAVLDLCIDKVSAHWDTI